MEIIKGLKRIIVFQSILLFIITILIYVREKEEFAIKFDVSYEALRKAYEWDVKMHGAKTPLNWMELLSYASVKNEGVLDEESCDIIDSIANSIIQGETSIEEVAELEKSYWSYYQLYDSILGNYVGEYLKKTIERDGTVSWEKTYGLKAFSPIAKGYEYTECDDFGACREYGCKRSHTGHDIMGKIGTPIIAIEDGVIETIGWNQYGGWRIGIRSLDQKRYYYYAHFREDTPYAENMEIGKRVKAGDVIGYMGRTGYSVKENVSNIETVHLHLGMKISPKGNWIDVYPLTEFLAANRSSVISKE